MSSFKELTIWRSIFFFSNKREKRGRLDLKHRVTGHLKDVETIKSRLGIFGEEVLGARASHTQRLKHKEGSPMADDVGSS